MRDIIRILRIKHLPYILASLISMLLLWIAYPLGLWVLGIMFFPIIWGGIYKLLNRNNNLNERK